jgi:predicted glycogen debranching enzyme
MASQPISIERNQGLDTERGLTTEWLDTNGLGDFASSTTLLCPTRRYHGLLVARPSTSNKRYCFLSRFDEIVRSAEGALALSTARYPDAFAPAGHEALQTFELAPHPRFSYAAGSIEIQREVALLRGEPTVLCRYKLERAPGPVQLELRPFLPFREADALTVENDALNQDVELRERGVRFQPYEGLPALDLSLGDADFRFTAEPVWYRSLELEREKDRGYPWREDQFSPGVLSVTLAEGEELVLAASISGEVEDPPAAWKREQRRRERAWRQVAAEFSNPVVARVAYTVDDFLFRDSKRLGVVAGYPWFGEWGRDAFIALPGLTLAVGRKAECEQALSGCIQYLNGGLLPNIYGLKQDDSDYGSIDAALWFARAVHLYECADGSTERIYDEYLPALLEIAAGYWDGTLLSRPADDGALIHAGTPEHNATWMDAVCPSGPVTPRDGCAVEVNALWYSLLQHLERMLAATGDRKAKRVWSERRRLAQRSFMERFWLDEESYLADSWNEGRVDTDVRPNMVIAAALELSPLKKTQRLGIVERARAELLTPRGLRTLSPRAADYRGTYGGNPEERDGAYHQGTVWPWLLGFYCEATLRARGTRKAVREELSAAWAAVAEELDTRGLNHLSEVFDGDAPHRGGGTIAQAWNTAELLRSHALLMKTRP